MAWKDILQAQVDDAYRAAQGLLVLVSDAELDWKPSAGENWMSTGQLIEHMVGSCGSMIKGFAAGEWSFPDQMPESVEGFPSVASVSEGREKLAADKRVALDTIADLSEQDLTDRMVQAPWAKTPYPLGHQLSQMISHLDSHKAQLFYYLKLQGEPVLPVTDGGCRRPNRSDVPEWVRRDADASPYSRGAVA